METKVRRQLKLGQIWKVAVYTSGLSDHEFQGYSYYELVQKQSGGMWLPKYICTEPNNIKDLRQYKPDVWVKSTEILKWWQPVEGKELQVLTVLFGSIT